MAVVSATSRHFQCNDMMIADVSHEIEGVTMQLLSLKTKSGKREAGFKEYFDKDILHFVMEMRSHKCIWKIPDGHHRLVRRIR